MLARKPLSEGSISANVLKHGTGAINIDGCRVETATRPLIQSDRRLEHTVYSPGLGGSKATGSTDTGRWPANVTHDNSDEVLAAFPDSAGQQGDVRGTEPSETTKDIYGKFGPRPPAPRREGEASANRRYTEEGATNFSALPGMRRDDGVSAARFFFSAKAGKEDRWGSKHPTVKPVELIRWLMRLITPPGGTILDPFAGSGTAGVAALAEGFDAILIEREAAYVADIEARLAFYRGEGGHSLAVKQRNATPRGLSEPGLFD